MIMYTLPFLLSMLRSMDEDARYLLSLFSYNDIIEQYENNNEKFKNIFGCK